MDDQIPRDLSLAGAALDASRLLLVIVDAEGLIVRVNRSVERATGRSGGSLLGSPFHELAVFAEERASLREACCQLASGRFPTGTLFHILNPAGESRIVDWANVVARAGAAATPLAVCVGVELSERAAATEALLETEARQRILLEQMPAVVWSTDRDLRFTNSVGSALTQLGLGPDLVATVGTSLYSYFHTDDDAHPIIAAHRQALEGQRVNFDTTWLGRDFQARVEPLVDARGETIGAVGVALDITERRQIERSRDDLLRREKEARLEANRARDDALEAVRARDQFLAVAAHELRTPLTSSLLDVQRLRRMVVARGPAPDKAPKTRSAETLAEACERQLHKLWQLMEQLLDVSRIAAHRFAMRIEEVDVAQVVRDVVSSLSADIRRAQCQVEVSAPPALVGRSDGTRLGQVVTNLVVNALKFGAGHPVEVTIEALARGVRLSVRDHGIGISPEDQARIFDRFERAVSITHFGGLGLGLYVSGEIVQALGGTIRVESEPGQGALFVVELPRDSAAA